MQVQTELAKNLASGHVIKTDINLEPFHSSGLSAFPSFC